MTKKLLAITCLVSAVSAYAQSPLEILSTRNQAELSAKEFASVLESDIEAAAAESEAICFTIKIYKDRAKHDAKAWQELVTQAVDMLKDLEEDLNDWVEDAAELFHNAYSKRGGDFGVHGEVCVNIEANKDDVEQIQEAEITREAAAAEEVADDAAEETTITCDCEKEDAADDSAEEPEAEITREVTQDEAAIEDSGITCACEEEDDDSAATVDEE